MMIKRHPAVMLAPALVPWTATHEFDEAVFREEVRAARDGLTPYLYLFGTAGEGYAVTDRQFDAVVRAFRKDMGTGSHPMIGLISLSTATIIERIAACRELGFQAFQLSLPAWAELNDHEIDAFFRETCGRFPDCQFLHYNLRRAKRLLTGDDYSRLAAAHPNLVAIKMGGEDIAAFSDILSKAPALRCFFTDFGYAAMRDAHECGYLVALGTLNFAQARAHFSARGSALAASVAELRQVHRAVKAALSDSSAHIDGVYDKLYVHLRNPRFPLRLLPPYESATAAMAESFRQGLPPGWV